jgi:hypothetical protein
MKQSRRITQARTEIIQCNVELRRLHTSICDEEHWFVQVLNNLKSSGDILYHPVLDFCTFRRRVNKQILPRILQTYSLPGFTGNPSPGVRKGRLQSMTTVDFSQCDMMVAAVNDDVDDVEELSDDDADEMDHIVDYMSSI